VADPKKREKKKEKKKGGLLLIFISSSRPKKGGGGRGEGKEEGQVGVPRVLITLLTRLYARGRGQEKGIYSFSSQLPRLRAPKGEKEKKGERNKYRRFSELSLVVL